MLREWGTLLAYIHTRLARISILARLLDGGHVCHRGICGTEEELPAEIAGSHKDQGDAGIDEYLLSGAHTFNDFIGGLFGGIGGGVFSDHGVLQRLNYLYTTSVIYM